MAGHLEAPRKSYAISQCALYKLRTKTRLEKILCCSRQDIRQLLKSDNYRCWGLESGERHRLIEEPKPQLLRVHVRIANLLRRVERPRYLYSGHPGCSAIRNARAHLQYAPTGTLDICSFFYSVKEVRIHRVFSHWLQCSPDVAAILTRICSRDGHLPTGSPLSQELALWAYRDLFDEIDRYVAQRGGVFSLYVDDMTITGPFLNPASLRSIGRMIERAGLDWHKGRIYGATAPKLITGVIVRRGATYLRNRHHQANHEELNRLRTMHAGPKRLRLVRRLYGRVNYGRAIDNRLDALHGRLRAELTGLQRKMLRSKRLAAGLR